MSYTAVNFVIHTIQKEEQNTIRETFYKKKNKKIK